MGAGLVPCGYHVGVGWLLGVFQVCVWCVWGGYWVGAGWVLGGCWVGAGWV